MKSDRPRRIVRNVMLGAGVAFILLLSFPQLLFAHETTYGRFHVYSREPLDPSFHVVLDAAEARLAASTIRDEDLAPNVFLTGSHRFYRSLSLNIGWNSFGKGYPMLPTNNVFINKSDGASDRVFRDAAENNSRSLSGVLAHEVTHLLIRKRYGYWWNLTMPAWKKEGYAEYVAGGSTLSYDVGVSLWKANPKDASGYRYFKYYMLVKHLLEEERISVDDLFRRDFDVTALEASVLSRLDP